MNNRVSKILRKVAYKLKLNYKHLKKGYRSIPRPRRHLHLTNLKLVLDGK